MIIAFIGYKDLIENIITTKARLEEYGYNPNVVVLNEHKYSELHKPNNGILTICGLEIKFVDLPDNFDFYIPSERVIY